MSTPTLIETVGATNANTYGTRAEADAYFDSVLHADEPWPSNVSASASIGSGTNGVVTVSVNTVGPAGNSYAIRAVLGSGNNLPLSVAEAASLITVTLGTDSAGAADPAKNTAILVAGAINSAVTAVTATYSGTGTTRIPVTAQKSFSGGTYNEETKNPALIMAAQQLDALIDWTGYPTSLTQRLSWPRTSMLKDHGLSFVPENEIPEEIKHAQFELARLLINSDRTAENTISASGITHLRAGPITVKFRDYGDLSASVLTSAVWNLIPSHWYTVINGMISTNRDLLRA